MENGLQSLNNPIFPNSSNINSSEIEDSIFSPLSDYKEHPSTPLSDEVPLQAEFKSLKKIKYIVARFDYDSSPPRNRIVAFWIQHVLSERKEYVETLIPIEQIDGMDDEDVLKIAYEKLSTEIAKVKKKLLSPVGREFSPIDDES